MMGYNIINYNEIYRNCRNSADRGFGNGFLLPAGPLRELPKSRLETVNLIIANGGENANADAVMFLQPQLAINLLTNEHCALSDFHSEK